MEFICDDSGDGVDRNNVAQYKPQVYVTFRLRLEYNDAGGLSRIDDSHYSKLQGMSWETLTLLLKNITTPHNNLYNLVVVENQKSGLDVFFRIIVSVVNSSSPAPALKTHRCLDGLLPKSSSVAVMRLPLTENILSDGTDDVGIAKKSLAMRAICVEALRNLAHPFLYLIVHRNFAALTSRSFLDVFVRPYRIPASAIALLR
ncbi:hypothetical protein V1507DRAFT_446295 [Lipomyces tetrasporus]